MVGLFCGGGVEVVLVVVWKVGLYYVIVVRLINYFVKVVILDFCELCGVWLVVMF